MTSKTRRGTEPTTPDGPAPRVPPNAGDEHRRKQDAPRPPGTTVREKGPDTGGGKLRPDER